MAMGTLRKVSSLLPGYTTDGETLIASEDGGPCVPKWHADPADAVTFETDGAAATFTRPGTVKIWATLANPDGTEVASNPLEVVVAAQ